VPAPSVWLVRAALAHLVGGATLGALLLTHKAAPLVPWLWRLRALHGEVLLFGWLVQLAMGVAFWILPRIDRSRGDVRPVWLAMALLNAGLWLTGVGTATGSPISVLAGRLAELAAVAAFARHAWPRVRAAGRAGA
jgi:hypothetical protein